MLGDRLMLATRKKVDLEAGAGRYKTIKATNSTATDNGDARNGSRKSKNEP
jgi:hypothetical protein